MTMSKVFVTSRFSRVCSYLAVLTNRRDNGSIVEVHVLEWSNNEYSNWFSGELQLVKGHSGGNPFNISETYFSGLDLKAIQFELHGHEDPDKPDQDSLKMFVLMHSWL